MGIGRGNSENFSSASLPVMALYAAAVLISEVSSARPPVTTTGATSASLPPNACFPLSGYNHPLTFQGKGYITQLIVLAQFLFTVPLPAAFRLFQLRRILQPRSTAPDLPLPA